MKKISASILRIAASVLVTCLLAACNKPRTVNPVAIPPVVTIQVFEPTSIPIEGAHQVSLTPTTGPVVIAEYQLEASPTPTRTFPTATPTKALPTATPTPVVTPDAPCNSIYPTRLYRGAFAAVSDTPALPNRLRSEPSTQGGASTVIGWIQPGEEVVLLHGPTCAEDWVWWQVASLSSGLVGWTSEGDGAGYWLNPLFSAPANWKADHNTVTLTAGLVQGANDIEAAIQRATSNGERPGTVILDGRQGSFVFTQPDRSLNLFVSNLVLLGVNGATLSNCADGLFFDDFPLQNIFVSGIEFNCEGAGVAAHGAFENVTLYQNTFHGAREGIGLGGASSNWMLLENVIQGGQGGMVASGAREFWVLENQITASNGLSLRECGQFQVLRNTIQASYQGIQLAQESWQNLVQDNTIQGVSRAGILLESGVISNQVLDNNVSCALGSSCLVLDAAPDAAANNSIRLAPVEKLIYSNDFERLPGSEWSPAVQDTAPAGQKFLGQFGSQAVTLNLAGLDAHTEVQIVFELYIIRSWDGNVDPDRWQFAVDGQPLLLTTFDTQDFFGDHSQSYPDIYKEGSHPPRTGAWANNTLGYRFSDRPLDMVYQLSFSVPHTASSLWLTFSAEGLSYDILDESWGIDNIKVYLSRKSSP